MSETFHLWAVAPAAIGTCCLAADRAQVRPPEVMASVLMLLAMLDAGLSRLIAPVWWTAMLLASAVTLAVWRRPRQRRAPRVPALMTLHTTLGMVVMAALQIGMSTHGVSAGHSHGVNLVLFLLAVAVGYAGLSVVAMKRMPARLDRAQIATMATSVGFMVVSMV